MSHSIRNFQGIVPKIGAGVYIDQHSVIIGDVILGDDVSVWPMAVLRGDVNSIKIGRACNIQDGAVLHVTHDGPYTEGGQPLILGQGITVGHKAVLHACTIDDYCLIGMGAMILDDVHIQHHVMVGAGSLVTPGKVLESGHLYLGNPARAVRKLSEKELEQLEYSAEHYVRLKNKYL
ncbi:MAG: gamma carbonic anhydrase family protein [Legionella sp.]|jgi:carbonic anhydrase/acetyltransferase-like protein (isoleucine patch superfamily)